MSPFVTPGGRLDALLRPAPGRSGFALRMALVCAIITMVVEIYQVPSLATIVYAPFFILRANRRATIVASIILPMFITIALLIAFVLTVNVLDHPFWRVVAMAVVSFFILYLGSASKLKMIAPSIALIVGYVLDLLGGLQVDELATRGLLYTWLIAGIPGTTCIIIALLVDPAPRPLLERALADRLAATAALLRSPDEETQASVDRLLRQGDAGLKELHKSARGEHGLPGGAGTALARAIDSTMAILSYGILLVPRLHDEASRATALGLVDTLGEMVAILNRGGYPIGVVPPTIDPLSLAPETASLLHLLRAEMAGFADGPFIVAPEEKSGFLSPDAFSNPAYARYALKTTAAALFCYLTFQQLDWPGIHTSLITCFVVSLGSAGETIEKLTLRITGCLVGAALGFGALIFVIPHTDSIVSLMAIIVAGTLPAAWVAAGGPRISYAGIQIAYAYYLVVLQGPAPAFDLTVGRDRVIGVLFGNVVVYLLFTKVWPVSISADVDPGIARLLHGLSTMSTAGLSGARRQIGATRNAVAGLRQLLLVARYEPTAVGQPRQWIDRREKALSEIDALQPSLLFAAALGGGDEAGRRLEALAERVRGRTAVAKPLERRTVLDASLTRIEALLVGGGQGATHAAD